MLCLFFNFAIIKIGGMPTIQTFDIWSDNDDNKLSGIKDFTNGTNNNINNNINRDPKGLYFYIILYFAT